MAEIKLHKDTVAPYKAEYIGVFNDNGELVDKFEINALKENYAVRKYRVGLLSDTHYNDNTFPFDGTIENDSSEMYPEMDLENALKFMTEKDSIDFICIAGDVSSDSINHVQSFHEKVKKFSKPFFTCKGNHDNAASKNGEDHNQRWLEYTIPTDSGYDIKYFPNGDGTSYYFVKDDRDVYIFLNVDYGNTITSAGRKYKAISKDGKEYEYYRYYDDEDLKTLADILNEHRNKRCFIFTHYFLSQKAGNPFYDYSYEESTDKLGNTHNRHYHTYCLSGRQFAILNEMNNHFKNSVWFSGHTHYKWKYGADSKRGNACNWDSFNGTYKICDSAYSILNISIPNGDDEDYKKEYLTSGYNVHIPSTSRPLKLAREDGRGYSIENPGSEFGVMDVYDDYVDIRGILGINENSESYEEYIPKRPSELDRWCASVDTSRSESENGMEVNDIEGTFTEDTIRIKFTSKDQGVIFNWMADYNHIKVESVKLTNGQGVDVTKKYMDMDNPKIGFYVSDTLKYSLRDCTAQLRSNANSTAYGPHISTSSSFSHDEDFVGGGLTLEMKVTFNKKDKKLIYDNQYLPYAHYRLNVGGKNMYRVSEKTYDEFVEIAETHL